jgi:uncharacterized DUF497 family protein
MKMKFSWDPNKEKINRRDHKVSFFDACQVFADRCLLTMYDEDHSVDEERWISMGQISNGKNHGGCAYLQMHAEKGIRKNYFGADGKQKGKSRILEQEVLIL